MSKSRPRDVVIRLDPEGREKFISPLERFKETLQDPKLAQEQLEMLLDNINAEKKSDVHRIQGIEEQLGELQDLCCLLISYNNYSFFVNTEALKKKLKFADQALEEFPKDIQTIGKHIISVYQSLDDIEEKPNSSSRWSFFVGESNSEMNKFVAQSKNDGFSSFYIELFSKIIEFRRPIEQIKSLFFRTIDSRIETINKSKDDDTERFVQFSEELLIKLNKLLVIVEKSIITVLKQQSVSTDAHLLHSYQSFSRELKGSIKDLTSSLPSTSSCLIL